MTSAFGKRPDFLPFSRPTIRQVEIDEVVDTLKSGGSRPVRRRRSSRRTLRPTRAFPHALALSSATAGQHIGLIALALKPGDEVITTPMTWASTVNMIEVAGATPVYVDIHRETLQIDERQLEAAVTSRTSASSGTLRRRAGRRGRDHGGRRQARPLGVRGCGARRRLPLQGRPRRVLRPTRRVSRSTRSRT